MGNRSPATTRPALSSGASSGRRERRRAGDFFLRDPGDNPVLVERRGRRVNPSCAERKRWRRSCRGKRGIVVAGMHGKTTTSAMTAHVLREGGLHPSHYVGAEIPLLGSNAHWDRARRIFRGGRGRERRHDSIFQTGAHAGFEHRGRASRFLRGPGGDRRRLFPTARSNHRLGLLLCGRSARGASLSRAPAFRFPSALRRKRIIAAPISTCRILRRFFAFTIAAKNWAKRCSTCPGATT